MFFNLVLLNQQHKGRFGFAWLAATRGVGYLKKTDILQLNINKLCDDIMVFVSSESDSPRSRFSLRLSALLINGTVKIHRQKAVLFMDELFKIMTIITAPPVIRLSLEDEARIFDTPPSPVIAKVRGKKRRRSAEKETPQSQLERIISKIQTHESDQIEAVTEKPTVLKARADEITLRETQLQPQEMDVGDLGVLGAFQPIEEELAREFGVEFAPPPIEEKIAQPLRPQAELFRKPSTSSSEPLPSHILTVEAQVHAPAERESPKKMRLRRKAPQPPSEMISEVEVPTEPRKEPAITEVPEYREPLEVPIPTEPLTVEVPKARRVLKELQVDEVETRDKEVIPRKEKKKKEIQLPAMLLLTKKPQKIRRINRANGELGPPRFLLLPKMSIRVPNQTKLLNLYFVKRVEIDLQQRERMPEVSPETTAIVRKSTQVTPPAQIAEERQPRVLPLPPEQLIEEQIPELIITEAPQMVSTPVSGRIPEIEQRTIEEIRARTREEDKSISSPAKKRKITGAGEPEFLKESDLLIQPEMPSRGAEITVSATLLPEQSIEPIPIPALTEKSRQQEIVNKIFESDKDQLTLEEICRKPINKLNVARAFSDLLVLCRSGYVNLISEDSSIELKFIEKGPKLNR